MNQSPDAVEDRTTGRARWSLPAAALALVLAAVVAVVAGAGSWLRVPLVALAVAATSWQAVRRGWRRPLVERVLTAVGAVLVGLVLTGIVLGFAGPGLRPVTWAVGLGVVAVGVLAWSVTGRRTERAAAAAEPTRVEQTGPGSLPAAVLRTTPWALAAVVVTVAAVLVSVRSVDTANVPPLQVSLASLDGARAVVAVSADEEVGPLELRTDPGDGSAVTYPLFSVARGETVRTDVVVPLDGRVLITVSNPGQVQPLRTLVVNR